MLSAAGPHYTGEAYLNLAFMGVMAFAWLSLTTFCLARRTHGQWATLGLVAGLLGLVGDGVSFAARAEVVLADNRGLAMRISQHHLPTILNGCTAAGLMLVLLALVASHLDTVRL